MEDREFSTLLEGLRAGQAQVQSDTWENEPELMSLLEEALSLYWECFSRLYQYEMASDLERTLVYLSVAAFHSLQSCFTLMELGYYRQAIVGTRALMNEYLLCTTFANDPQCAAEYLGEADWATVRELAADVLPEIQLSDASASDALALLSTALEERFSWTSYVALEDLARCKALPKELRTKLKPLRDELTKDRIPGMTKLLRKLENTLLSREKTLGYLADLELLHRHAHSAWVAIRAEVLARDEQGGQWITPRYERDRCRYCGYRLALWSAAVLSVMTARFERLDADKAWKDRLTSFQEALLSWGQRTDLEQKAVTP